MTAGAAGQESPPPPASEPPPNFFGLSQPSYVYTRPTDPAAVTRGKSLYVSNGCSFCHGADIRGGSGGISLLRSQKVLKDQKGETIAEVITKGVPNTTMVAFNLSPTQIADIAEFLHSFTVGGNDEARMRPPNIVTGKAAVGKRYFASTCTPCHSVNGDLAGIATRIPDARDLQQRWLMPAGGDAFSRSKPTPGQLTTVSVTQADGSRWGGTLERGDEFLVVVKLADGTQRTAEFGDAQTTIVVKNPMAEHKALLSKYSDADIHNLTAYLVTLK
jgi:cytochrome c oxidase cbb3-type subunit III